MTIYYELNDIHAKFSQIFILIERVLAMLKLKNKLLESEWIFCSNWIDTKLCDDWDYNSPNFNCLYGDYYISRTIIAYIKKMYY